MSKHLPAIGKTLFAFLLFIAFKSTAVPVITSFSPASGVVGTNVTITGTNFNVVPTNNIVFFGAVKATVLSGSPTSLNVMVPAGATWQPISVLDPATSLTGYSSKPFITTFSNLSGGMPASYLRPKVDFEVGVNPRNVVTGDLDGDGKPEIVVPNGNSGTISVLRNTTVLGPLNPTFFAPRVDFATGTFLEYVAIGDVDGDGKPDLVFIQSGSIAVMRNTATTGVINAASFAAKVNYTPLFTGAFAVAIGDVDGDGWPDLVSVNSTANTVSIVRNTSTPGNLSFAPKVDFSTGSTPSSIAIDDVDGDGKRDILVSNAATGANSISVLRNTSTPGVINPTSFAAKVNFATGEIPRSIVTGDLDGDGKPDVVVANNVTAPPASTTLSVLRNTSILNVIAANSFAPKVDFTAGTAPRAVAIGNLDGNAKPDIVVANLSSNTISLLGNTSSAGSITAASFAPKVDFPTGLGPVAVTTGDLNGDGIPEIVTANGSGSSVSVFQIESTVLPITLSNVKAYQKNAGVQIEWTTQQENNINSYEVERSKDGQQFIKLGTVIAKGNSGTVVKYDLFDANPLHGASLYRIKIIEAATETYSQLVRVNITGSSEKIVTVYPNPVRGNSIALQINLEKGNYILSLTNKLGQQVVTKSINHAGGSATASLEISKTLATGIYQLSISGMGIKIIRQVTKN